MGADELEEHQAYGDSTLGCNEATEQHDERSDRAMGAARRGALPFRRLHGNPKLNCFPLSLFFYRINLRFTTSLLSSLPLRISSLRSLTFIKFLAGRKTPLTAVMAPTGDPEGTFLYSRRRLTEVSHTPVNTSRKPFSSRLRDCIF